MGGVAPPPVCLGAVVWLQLTCINQTVGIAFACALAFAFCFRLRADAAALLKAQERATSLAHVIDLETRMLAAKKAAAEAEVRRRELAVSGDPTSW